LIVLYFATVINLSLYPASTAILRLVFYEDLKSLEKYQYGLETPYLNKVLKNLRYRHLSVKMPANNTHFTGLWRPSIPGWVLPAIGAAKELLALGKLVSWEF
jgi:hypothetical protein